MEQHQGPHPSPEVLPDSRPSAFSSSPLLQESEDVGMVRSCPSQEHNAWVLRWPGWMWARLVYSPLSPSSVMPETNHPDLFMPSFSFNSNIPIVINLMDAFKTSLFFPLCGDSHPGTPGFLL